ncbi:isochorismate synthase [Parabacteroides sp. AM08-6]|uniref:isochorismate synthase n=1 Tax=Parabacteroides sp. AM08-6 TaxID=2292053 RepID=UPI000EFED710|nr:isochorismate synthase [Parabacteroides sp. AM08-6]RHJ83466.1 isochorismate synthase [Parabacteroides sp. AM08-6]
MTSEEIQRNSQTIDKLIKQNRNFAIWRIPGKEPRFIMQSSGSARIFHHIKELDEQCGFVIAPFQSAVQLPIVLIQPDCFEIPENLKEDEPSGEFPYFPSENKVLSIENEKINYSACFELFIHSLQEKRFDKLVLSRSRTITRSSSFSAGSVFFQACARYKYSYVYLCHTPQTGTWLGSTPEIILAGENGEWHTVALAGTQPLQNGELPTQWDDKNKEEQGFVASYIRTQLTSLGIKPSETAPYSVRAGELSHLKNDFYFQLPNNRRLGDLLQLLHPTPAVCGLPKEKAYRFILAHEGYNRSYYSGFVGWIDPEKRSDLYVNLRCMNITDRTLTLYAGGGLLPSSRMADEWNETEAKMKTMERLID